MSWVGLPPRLLWPLLTRLLPCEWGRVAVGIHAGWLDTVLFIIQVGPPPPLRPNPAVSPIPRSVEIRMFWSFEGATCHPLNH